MNFVTSLILEHKFLELWASERLVALIAGLDASDPDTYSAERRYLIAYGIDPDKNEVVFVRKLETGGQGAFVQALIDGDEKRFTTETTDVVVKPPPTPWPRMEVVLSYARALAGVQSLAQAQGSQTLVDADER